MTDKSLSMFLMVLFGASGVAVLALAWLGSMPGTERIMATFAGAFGLDLVVAYVGNSCGHHTVAYIGLATVEEVLEMAGIIGFVYALLLYMSSELKWIRVRIAEQWK